MLAGVSSDLVCSVTSVLAGVSDRVCSVLAGVSD